MKATRGTCAALMLAAYLLQSSAAAGQERRGPGGGTAEDRAVRLYERSEALYQEGRFDEAIELLREAYATFPDPTLLYNLARAEEARGDLGPAIEAYERFLAAAPDSPDRGAIEGRIASLRQQVAERERLAEEARREEEARRRAEERLARERARERERPPPPPPNGVSPLPWIVAGVGVAGIATGAVFGAFALARHDDATAEPSQVESDRLQKEAESFATMSTVALVAGAILTAGGVTWGVLDLVGAGGDEASAAARLELAPTGVRLSGAF